jgi:hypothetical protein
VFPKDVLEWENWIRQGKALYLDKEKVEAVANTRNPGDVATASTHNIIKNFPDVK